MVIVEIYTSYHGNRSKLLFIVIKSSWYEEFEQKILLSNYWSRFAVIPRFNVFKNVFKKIYPKMYYPAFSLITPFPGFWSSIVPVKDRLHAESHMNDIMNSTITPTTHRNDVCTRDRVTWTGCSGRCCCPRSSKCSSVAFAAVRPATFCCTAAVGWHGRRAATRSRTRSRSTACGSATRRTCWTGPVPGTTTRCTRTDGTSSAPVVGRFG